MNGKSFMKRGWEFLKTTTVTGLFVLLPVVLVAKVLGEVVHFAHKAAAPVLKLLPKDLVANPKFPTLFAVVVIVVTCFVVGLLTRLALARAIGKWVESHFLQAIPGYKAIKSLASGLSGSLEESAFKAAALTSPDGGNELVYLIEDHGDGFATVMIPSAPNPMGGAIKIVPRERIKLLDAKIPAVARILSQWGVGAHDLLRKEKPS
jgi:uncharacterized membrane protein